MTVVSTRLTRQELLTVARAFEYIHLCWPLPDYVQQFVVVWLERVGEPELAAHVESRSAAEFEFMCKRILNERLSRLPQGIIPQGV